MDKDNQLLALLYRVEDLLFELKLEGYEFEEQEKLAEIVTSLQHNPPQSPLRAKILKMLKIRRRT